MPSTPKPLIVPAGLVGTFFARCVVSTLRALPRAAHRVLAHAVGALAYGLGIRRGVTLENLGHAFPERTEAERRRIARDAYVNMALAAIEALTSSRLTDDEVEQAVVLENWAPLQAAIDAGKGVLVATAHFGSWELFANLMVRRGVPLSAVVRPLRGAFNARIVESRQKVGLGLILQRGAVSEVSRAVGEGRVVAQLVDQVLPATKGVFVPFFGRPASTTPGLSVVAQRTGAPVFVVLAARDGGRLRVFVEGPVQAPKTGDRQRDLEAHVAQMTAIIERYIRRYPDQWLWLHRRWKEQPPAPLKPNAKPDPEIGDRGRD
ncbi:MAG: lysophospholipid acyltransferase family protein [Myxococcota bacterium]